MISYKVSTSQKPAIKNLLFYFIYLFLMPISIMAQTIRFSDITDEKEAWGNRENGVSCYGHGVAMADISGDSLPDLYISNAVRNANKLPEVLYISQKNGTYIENDRARGVDDNYGSTGSHGIIFVDYDNDGDFDIFNATTDDRIRLYCNRGDGYFDDVTDAAHIPAMGYGTRGIVAFDANNDGYMDLLGVNWGPAEDENNIPQITLEQPNEFYLNKGDGTFAQEDSSGLTPVNPSHIGTQGVTAIDVDNDGDMDVFVCHRNYAYLGKDENGNDHFGPDWNNPAPNELFINDGTGHFKEEAKARGIYNPLNDSNGTIFVDYDNDGDLDVFVVPKQKFQIVNVYRNRGNGYFDDITSEMNIWHWGFSMLFLDVDNDGDLDAYAMNTGKWTRKKNNTLYLNDGQGHLTEIDGTGLEIYSYDPRGGAVGDIDDDGDLDIYFVDANKNIDSRYGNYLLRNDTQTSNRWLKVYGRGPKGDMAGFGTKIWVFDQTYMEDMSHLVGYHQVINAYGYLCQDEPIQHFGLGQRDSVDVKIQLLDGTTLKAFNVPAKKKIFFSKPDELVQLGGDEQQGSSGQMLTDPLQVRVLDKYSNPVIGVAVQFQVVNDNGYFIENLPVYTDYRGIAQVRYVVGNMNREQHIQASSPLVSGQSVDFKVYSTSQNTTPELEWTGEAGYESDGVKPDQGNAGDNFEFRAKYTDANGDAPKDGYPQVHIKKGNTEITDSPFSMAEADTGDFITGRIYTYSTNTLAAGTDYTYWFEAYDSQDNKATGEPTQEHPGQVIFGLMAPAVTGMEIVNSRNLQLTWDAVTGASGYNVYRFTEAYFKPDRLNGTNRVAYQIGDEDGNTAGVQWTDADEVVGDWHANYFYVVTAVNGSVESDPSNRVGEFDYRLVTTAKTDFNEIAIPLRPFLVNQLKASLLMGLIPRCNSVARWNAEIQGYDQYIQGIPPTDFEVRVTFPYYVNVVKDTTYTLLGEVVEPLFRLITTATTDFNEVMLPLSKTDITTASQLMLDIASCNSVARWNAEMQGYNQYIPGIPPTDFDVRVGYPYYVNVTSDVEWPGGGSLAKVVSGSADDEISGAGMTYAPHAVYGELGEGRVREAEHFKAYIRGRENDILTEESAGCYLKGGSWVVQVGSFSRGWRGGEVLEVVFKSGQGGVLGYVECEISYDAYDKVDVMETGVFEVPSEYMLEQNFPNPFNNETVIRYELAARGEVMMDVLNVNGRHIRMLIAGEKEAGKYEAKWDGRDDGGEVVASGMYIIVMRSGDVMKKIKALFMK